MGAALAQLFEPDMVQWLLIEMAQNRDKGTSAKKVAPQPQTWKRVTSCKGHVQAGADRSGWMQCSGYACGPRCILSGRRSVTRRLSTVMTCAACQLCNMFCKSREGDTSDLQVLPSVLLLWRIVAPLAFIPIVLQQGDALG